MELFVRAKFTCSRYTKYIPMHVLVIEDEPSIREAEAAYLRQAGYAVTEAADGERALAVFHAERPDLVIVDVNIPIINGLVVCQRIRDTSTVPIIVVTANDSDEDELAGLAAGADDYIRKPFNPRVLVARVQNMLHRHGTQRLASGSLMLDPAAMLVSKAGSAVTMTTTQFNVLSALMSHPGLVLSRDQLIDMVYTDPAGHDIYDRTIDAHIKSIRKLIEDDPAHPVYIQTVIGAGYRFWSGS